MAAIAAFIKQAVYPVPRTIVTIRRHAVALVKETGRDGVIMIDALGATRVAA